MINLKHFILLLLILFVTPDASCQYTNFQLETAYTFGKIIKHTAKLYHNPSNFSSNFELSLTKKRNGNSIWENKYGQPTTGFTFTYINSNDKIIGYVPNSEIKELCKNNITEPLKIINIKIINNNYGIRVIPKCFYVYDPILESNVFFSDE